MYSLWISIGLWAMFLIGFACGMLWRGNWDLQDRRGHGHHGEGTQ